MSNTYHISNLYKYGNQLDLIMPKKRLTVTLDISLCDTISTIINNSEHKPSFSQVLNNLALRGLENKKGTKKNAKK